ncbi:hypothetical protein [Nostoc sp.]|uniref:hypothetical protein n=1 Tax=Nostoc sp. TaxID=1180 RepID=UPI002FFA23C2
MLALAFVSMTSNPQQPIAPTPEKPVNSREAIANVFMVRSMKILGLNFLLVRRRTNLLGLIEGIDD